MTDQLPDVNAPDQPNELLAEPVAEPTLEDVVAALTDAELRAAPEVVAVLGPVKKPIKRPKIEVRGRHDLEALVLGQPVEAEREAAAAAAAAAENALAPNEDELAERLAPPAAPLELIDPNVSQDMNLPQEYQQQHGQAEKVAGSDDAATEE